MSDVGPVDVPKTKCDCPHCREKDPKPFGIILHCPQCGRQHIDELGLDGIDWSKKLHRKHRCVDGVLPGCGFEWQPALVYTVGVRSLT